MQQRKVLPFNFIVNILDGGFFGFALGFASFVTVLPLFVSTMTDSAILIGLIPALHTMGWQLPQLLTSRRVGRLSRYKPMVLFMTIHERIPFLGLAIVAWFLPSLGRDLALVLTFLLLTWQGLGGGFTATAWQSMIGKIMPSERLGTFFGAQSAAANLFASAGAVLAGILLQNLSSPYNFAVCFLLASICMMISWLFLSSTREPPHRPVNDVGSHRAFWKSVGEILRCDGNFRWFIGARMLSQVSVLGSAFYTVYAVRVFGMSAEIAGVMTGVLMIVQVGANPLMGWISDRWSRRVVIEVGALAASGSALLAWLAPSLVWFYGVFILAGIANVAFWTIAMAMTLEFGTSSERPAYIGLANTLIAPSTILVPILGGWLVNLTSYSAAFVTSAAGGLATAVVLQLLVRNPGEERQADVTVACGD